MRTFSPLLRAYFILVGAVGGAVFVVQAWTLPPSLAVPVVISGLGAALSELSQSLLPSGVGVSVGWAIVTCSIIAFGPAGTVWVQFIGAVITGAVRRTQILPFIFNLGNMIFTAAAGAWIFHLLGGRAETLSEARTWFAVIASMGLVYAANSLVGAVAFTFYNRGGFLSTWSRLLSQTLPSFVTLLALGLALTAAFLHFGSVALVGLVVLILVLHYALRAYTGILQERAVAGFLSRSEARAGHFRAHSERVVGYATAIANELGLRRQEVTLLRYAAWLHDVALWQRQKTAGGAGGGEGGRGGVWGTVDSAVRGAATVAALGPLVPVSVLIRHQCERFDGKGGPDGLAGEDIPAGARVLAVAEYLERLTADGTVVSKDGIVSALEAEAGKALCPRAVEAVKILKAEMPQVKIVMLTVSTEDRDLFAAISNGADGYLLKNLQPSQLFEMLEGVRRGEAPVSGALAARILQELRRPRAHPSTHSIERDDLTPREIEVLGSLVDGKTNREIAETLCITENTVKMHLRAILDKLHVESRTQAVALALKAGLVKEA